MIKSALTIFIGGGLGASLRFIITTLTPTISNYNFPLATFSINIIACFLMGLLCAIFMDKTNISPAIKLALTVGFCGGFSTYTAFSVELLEMLNSTQFLQAILYITATIIFGLVAVWMGVCFAKLL